MGAIAETIEELNDRAHEVDELAARRQQKAAVSAASLRARCAPTAELAAALDEAPPVLVGDLPPLAARLLGAVALVVGRGRAGAIGGAEALGTKLGVTGRWMRKLIGDLQRAGWLVVVPDYIPAAESALGGAYVTYSKAERRRRQPRSLRVDLAYKGHRYHWSRTRNVLLLGARAKRLQLGARAALARCGQLEGQQPKQGQFLATALPLRGRVCVVSDVLSPPDDRRSCDSVDNSTRSGDPEASLRSAEVSPLRGDAEGCSAPSAPAEAGEGEEQNSRPLGLWRRFAAWLRGGAS